MQLLAILAKILITNDKVETAFLLTGFTNFNLGEVILTHSENLSKTSQASNLPVLEGHDVAHVTIIRINSNK